MQDFHGFSVSVSWLHERAQANDDERAPDVWTRWVKAGVIPQWPTGETLDRAGRLRRYEAEETVVSEAFRSETFERYAHSCAMTGIQKDPLLDLAHILPRSQRPDLAEDPENVLVLNSLHHRAFDAALFAIDSHYRIRTSPAFEPAHPFLQETIIEREGDPITLPPAFRYRLRSWRN